MILSVFQFSKLSRTNALKAEFLKAENRKQKWKADFIVEELRMNLRSQ